jgi:hypothetical protein
MRSFFEIYSMWKICSSIMFFPNTETRSRRKCVGSLALEHSFQTWKFVTKIYFQNLKERNHLEGTIAYRRYANYWNCFYINRVRAYGRDSAPTFGTAAGPGQWETWKWRGDRNMAKGGCIQYRKTIINMVHKMWLHMHKVIFSRSSPWFW